MQPIKIVKSKKTTHDSGVAILVTNDSATDYYLNKLVTWENIRLDHKRASKLREIFVFFSSKEKINGKFEKRTPGNFIGVHGITMDNEPSLKFKIVEMTTPIFIDQLKKHKIIAEKSTMRNPIKYLSQNEWANLIKLL